MSNGTSGNINNINFRDQGRRPSAPYAQIRKVADLLAAEAVRVAGSIEYRDWVPLAMREARCGSAAAPTPKDEVARAKFILSQGQGRPARVASRRFTPARRCCSTSIRRTSRRSCRRCASATWASPRRPARRSSRPAWRSRRPARCKPTFTIELANDYRGYLPTAEHHQLGGYETWRARSSYLEVDAEAKIRGKILELLGKV